MTTEVRTRPLDDDRHLLDLAPERGDLIAWVRGGEGLVAWGEAARITPAAGPGRFASADAALCEVADHAIVDDAVGVPGGGVVGVGSFAFDDDAGGSVLVVPRVVVGRRGGVTWVTTVDPPGAAPVDPPRDRDDPTPTAVGGDRPRYAGSSNPDVRWLEAVADVIERIRRGEVDKVVLARDHAVWSHEPFSAPVLARRLTRRFPSCHTFVVDGLVGATPELLLSRDGDRVTSRVLAGTAPRSTDTAVDAETGRRLLASAKDLQEHAFATASVEAALAPHCRELEHDPRPELLRLDNVQHLSTTFRGQLAGSARSLDIVADLHPTAAVGGSPRPAALAVIRELEGMSRGRYAAPVGWTTPEGDGEWGIALRCAELAGARARLFAGVGVVADSLPEDELEETRLKLLAMQAALDPSR